MPVAAEPAEQQPSAEQHQAQQAQQPSAQQQEQAKVQQRQQAEVEQQQQAPPALPADVQLAVRLSNGASLRGSFQPSAPLAAVLDWIDAERSDRWRDWLEAAPVKVLTGVHGVLDCISAAVRGDQPRKSSGSNSCAAAAWPTPSSSVALPCAAAPTT